jgi:hypothetical protein
LCNLQVVILETLTMVMPVTQLGSDGPRPVLFHVFPVIHRNPNPIKLRESKNLFHCFMPNNLQNCMLQCLYLEPS